MSYVNLAGVWEAVPPDVSVGGIQTDPTSLFGYVLLAIALLAVWWGDRQARGNPEELQDELRDEPAASPLPGERETEDGGGESEDV